MYITSLSHDSNSCQFWLLVCQKTRSTSKISAPDKNFWALSFAMIFPLIMPSFEEKIFDVVGQLADLTFSGENRPKIKIGHNFFLRARRDHVV